MEVEVSSVVKKKDISDIFIHTHIRMVWSFCRFFFMFLKETGELETRAKPWTDL